MTQLLINELPTQPRGRSLAWQGVLLLVAIEATVVASLIASYFYLRMGHPMWPPAEVPLPSLTRPTVAQALLILSAVPIWWMERRFRRGEAAKLGWLLGGGVLLACGYVTLSVLDLAKLSYRWYSHAYGSISWTLTAYQLLHLAAILGLSGYVAMSFALGRLQKRRSASVEVLALYWYFVAISSAAVWATLYVSPHLM